MGFAPLGVAYPWDAVVPLRERAATHPDGLVDLSIGTPVDPTPRILQDALATASDAHGYPTVAGPTALRQSVVDWFGRRRGVTGLTPDHVLPTIGSKELVALLPSQLGLGPGDVVVIPTQAYPTYEIGARLAGAEVLASDDPADWVGREEVALVWLNSPGNPTGRVLPAAAMAEVVRAARATDAVVASDECYAMLPWTSPWTDAVEDGGGVPCVLREDVSGGDPRGLLAVYSLSKQSNLAGYRAAFAAGDPDLVGQLLLQRRHLGMMVPAPVQHVMRVALDDDAHVAEQAARYAARRALLLPALLAAGFELDHSEAGLYLWVRPGEGLRARLEARPAARDRALCWASMDLLADLGIVAGPGEFYGPAAQDHVRVSLTESDANISSAAGRLRALA
ncbi:succinyldiaminopimelate transaminase [Miniimonas arenae]|uniref:Aminotransferase n=1 Tax=Miniimonas arenae TaxID=676201 RepID=A0A5C5BAK7_9MICO|nr:succinyldiaminopimelate transaminase [Miniimonas arenae]TNU73519.1 succinyldiaminopimelate transaminase [Miniimonas arenae]